MKLFFVVFLGMMLLSIPAVAKQESITKECYGLEMRLSNTVGRSYENQHSGTGMRSYTATLICVHEMYDAEEEIADFLFTFKVDNSIAYANRNEMRIRFRNFHGNSLSDILGTYYGFHQITSFILGVESFFYTNGHMVIKDTSIVAGAGMTLIPFSEVNITTENVVPVIRFHKAKSRYLIPDDIFEF